MHLYPLTPVQLYRGLKTRGRPPASSFNLNTQPGSLECLSGTLFLGPLVAFVFFSGQCSYCLVFSLQINSSLRPHERSPCSSGASILADEASPASVAASLLLPPRSPYPSDTLYHNMLSLITQPSRNLPSVLSLHHPCISFLRLP